MISSFPKQNLKNGEIGGQKQALSYHVLKNNNHKTLFHWFRILPSVYKPTCYTYILNTIQNAETIYFSTRQHHHLLCNQQKTEISMGTICATLIAHLFLYCYESQFIAKSSPDWNFKRFEN